MTKLKGLDCSRNQIQSLEPIEQMNKMQYLNCHHNNIRSLRGIENFTNLKSLSCFELISILFFHVFDFEDLL